MCDLFSFAKTQVTHTKEIHVLALDRFGLFATFYPVYIVHSSFSGQSFQPFGIEVQIGEIQI